MNILAIETCLDACALALLQGGELVFQSVDVMERGQAEAIAPLAQRAFAAANFSPRALDRIVVTVGPGSFTGVRVGLAFARGLAVALNIDCIGVSTLEALTLGEAENLRASVIATPAALYAALYGAGETLEHDREKWEPVFAKDHAKFKGIESKIDSISNNLALIPPRRFDSMPAAAAAISGAAAGEIVAVAGPGREELARLMPAARVTGAARPDPVLMAHWCAGRDPTTNPPTPLYLRAALEP